MWNFDFANMMNSGVPLGGAEVFRVSELFLELVVWLFIAACFGIGLSYLRAAISPLRRVASRSLNAKRTATRSSGGPDLGAAA